MAPVKCDRVKGQHAAVMIINKSTPASPAIQCCVCTLEKYETIYGNMPFKIVESFKNEHR